jgi:hypothetical protein
MLAVLWALALAIALDDSYPHDRSVVVVCLVVAGLLTLLAWGWAIP